MASKPLVLIVGSYHQKLKIVAELHSRLSDICVIQACFTEEDYLKHYQADYILHVVSPRLGETLVPNAENVQDSFSKLPSLLVIVDDTKYETHAAISATCQIFPENMVIKNFNEDIGVLAKIVKYQLEVGLNQMRISSEQDS